MIIDDLKLYGKLKEEQQNRQREYKRSVKGLKEQIKTLEQDIVKQVLESGKTVTVGNVSAEYKPTVIIKIVEDKAKEDEDE